VSGRDRSRRRTAGGGAEAAPLSLVTARSRAYLRTTSVVLGIVVALAACVLVYLERGHLLQQREFEDNSNLRLLSVSHRVGPDGAFEALDLDDAARVGRTLRAGTTAGEDVPVSTRYEFGGGIPASDGRTFIVYGLDPALAPVLGLTEMLDGVAYGVGGPAGTVELQVPVVTAAEDGYDSTASAPLPLTLSTEVDPSSVEYLQGGNPADVLYVTSTTFQRAAELMFGVPWATVEQQWATGALPMTPLVGAVYAYLPDIALVEPAARQLDEQGYATTYGLQAFDDIEGSLRQTTLLGGGLALLLLGTAALHLALTWRSYLRLSRRDIAILKHWRVDDRSILRAYSRQLARTCLPALAGGAVVGAVAALAMLGLRAGLVATVANVAVLAASLALVHVVARTTVIGPRVRQDVLTLLRREREFQ